MAGTSIESDLVVDGNLESPEGTVCVRGKVKGKVVAKAVEIADGGQIKGSVKADSVVINGLQSGSVKCAELVLGPTSDVDSKVTAKTMASEKGARIVGELQVTGD